MSTRSKELVLENVFALEGGETVLINLAGKAYRLRHEVTWVKGQLECIRAALASGSPLDEECRALAVDLERFKMIVPSSAASPYWARRFDQPTSKPGNGAPEAVSGYQSHPTSLSGVQIHLSGNDRLITAISTLLQDYGCDVSFDNTATLPPEDLGAPDAPSRLVLHLSSDARESDLLSFDRRAAETGTSWIPLSFEVGRGFLGPLIVPGRTADYRDVSGRKHLAAGDSAVHEAFVTQDQDSDLRMPAVERNWVLATAALLVSRLAVGLPTLLDGNQLELSPDTLEVTPHPVLPLPDRMPPHFVPSQSADERLLVSRRTGIINNVQQMKLGSDLPASIVTFQTRTAHMLRRYDWHNDRLCGGASFTSSAAAKGAAIGEGIERYCGNWMAPGSPVKVANYRDLSRTHSALDPNRLVLYSEGQYDNPAFPFPRLTHDDEISWVEAESLTRGESVWVPASAVYVRWFQMQPAEKSYHYPLLPGIAAGRTREEAVVSAIEEIIERDATMIWWHNAHPLRGIHLGTDLEKHWPEDIKGDQCRWALELPNEFGVPVVAGVTLNRSKKLFNIGFAARPTASEATLKALTEAALLQATSETFARDRGVDTLIDKQLIELPNLKPWREDRKYLDSYQANFHDVKDLMCQAQIFLDPRAHEAVRNYTDPTGEVAIADIASLRDRSLAVYQERVEAQGYEILVADLTTPDVAAAGFSVVRVLIPGLAPNAPAAFPFLGHDRLRKMSVQLGWHSEIPSEDELNYFPLPHA